MIDAPAPATPTATLTDVRADLSRRELVDTNAMSWEASPSGTVWRKPLYREGGEFGPVTSLVRYAPGRFFPEHTHPEGEEILVIEGEFADEHGRYPAGTWMRSPHLSRHTPFSDTGCLIYVRVGGL
jgi:anti-sigma factor ChrR (cupin superfamily)